MNYLRIENKGLIVQEDLMLIGSSTKRDQTGKIGMFGSGWKYALSWLLRNDCKPIIYAGKTKIDIDFNVTMHRTNAVNVITVNGKETSLTTEMGPKWTGWMAIREILSNAIDEGEHKLDVIWEANMGGEEGKTVIYVPMNGELSDVMLKFDSYFAFNRKESFTVDGDRVFMKATPSPLNVYRKGIRCYDTNANSSIDFDFNHIDINEDRLAYGWNVQKAISRIVGSNMPSSTFKRFLQEEQLSWLPSSTNENILANLKELISHGESFTTETLQKLGGMLFSKADALLIPAGWYKKLQDLGLIKNIFDMFGGEQSFIRTDAKSTKGIEYHLKALNINVDIKTGKCDSHVFFHKDTAYVKDDTDQSDSRLAAMIIKSLDTDYLEKLLL